eukprot:1306566-Prymnesium_polylepis.1
MMLYKPGYDDVQREIWMRELQSVLTGSTPVYCIYHDWQGAGHFSAMRVSERQSPAAVDLTSSHAHESRKPLKCAKTGVKPRSARLLSVMMSRVLDLDSSRHLVKKWKVSLMIFDELYEFRRTGVGGV